MVKFILIMIILLCAILSFKGISQTTNEEIKIIDSLKSNPQVEIKPNLLSTEQIKLKEDLINLSDSLRKEGFENLRIGKILDIPAGSLIGIGVLGIAMGYGIRPENKKAKGLIFGDEIDNPDYYFWNSVFIAGLAAVFTGVVIEGFAIYYKSTGNSKIEESRILKSKSDGITLRFYPIIDTKNNRYALIFNFNF